MVPETLRHTLKILAACTPSRGTTSPTNIWSRGTMMRGSPIPCSTCAVSKLATIQSLVIGRSKKHPIAVNRQVKKAPNRYPAQACDQDRTSLHQPSAQNNDASCIRDKLWP